MISEKLLSEVLKDDECFTLKFKNNEIVKTWLFDEETNIFMVDFKDNQWFCINIYELAYKCKEWAFNNYEIMLESAVMFNASGCKVIDKIGFCVMVTDAKTESEAIFKACKYILDNKDK